MKFDKRFVYFMWDDELEGKEGFFADSINVLKSCVEDNDDNHIGNVSFSNREDFPFCNDCGGMYRFFYYDPEYPEWDEKDKETVYYCYLDKDEESIQFMFTCEKPSSHIYATFTDDCKATKWCYSHDKFAEIAKAWEDGKTIQYYEYDWCDICEPHWDLNSEYRVKPEPVEVETSKGKMYLANGAEIPKKRRMTNRELARWLAKGNGQKATIHGNAVCCHGYELDDDDKEVEDCMIRGWDEAKWHEPVIEEE